MLEEGKLQQKSFFEKIKDENAKFTTTQLRKNVANAHKSSSHEDVQYTYFLHTSFVYVFRQTENNGIYHEIDFK